MSVVSTPYPFSAVVGLADLRLALIINAVSPAVGGVLVRGEKGTAKSTVVRALASLLPAVTVLDGCRFSCDPVSPDRGCPDLASHGSPGSRPARLVELPVGASEDRLTGSLDLERALTSGVSAYEPGLLAAAHRGVLYVDEVNLLHDHLVDLLLDAAALGTSYVEREGVSVRHAARFLLVGTMNPEEGELRPQLLDRFGLTVEVAATRDPAERADVVRRRLAYEADPDAFAAQYADSDADLAAHIAAARERLGRVVLGDRALREVTTVCAAFDVDGLRADLVTAKAAVALAAWAGRDEVTTDDVRTAARLALPHRRRRGIHLRHAAKLLRQEGPGVRDAEGKRRAAGRRVACRPGRKHREMRGQRALGPTGHDHRHPVRHLVPRQAKPLGQHDLQRQDGMAAGVVVDAAVAFGLAHDRDDAARVEPTGIDQRLNSQHQRIDAAGRDGDARRIDRWMHRAGVACHGFAQCRQAEVVRIKSFAAVDRIDRRLANDFGCDFITLTEPEGEHVVAAESRVGDLADFRGFQVLDGFAHVFVSALADFVESLWLIACFSVQLVGNSARAASMFFTTRKP